ncbi:MAG: hypothetical protein QXR73_01650 [Candidatus Micrarchaeaceae archaeon]
MAGKKTCKCGICMIIVIALLVSMALAAVFFIQHSIANRTAYINVTDVVSIYNNAGYLFFGRNGYIITANYTPTKFPLISGLAVFNGLETTVDVGPLSLSSSVIALIFNSSVTSSKYASDSSAASEYFSYEMQNPNVSAYVNTYMHGVIVHFYNISTVLETSQSTVLTIHNTGVVFSYDNVLFMGFFKNFTQAYNVTSYITKELSALQN